MSATDRYLPLAARCLLALVFLLAGLEKVFGWTASAQYMAAKGMPVVPLFLIGAIALELGGSLSVILGLKARWGAAALILFTIPTTLIFHDFWALDGAARQINQIMFMKNLAMIGGLLLVVRHGAGALSLDARKNGGHNTYFPRK